MAAPESNDDYNLAAAIAAHRWRGRRNVRIRSIGEGSNNISYLASDGNGRILIKLSRPHREAQALDEYRKERWCAGQARARGVPTPEILDLDVWEGRAFTIQSYVEGHRPLPTEEVAAWQALGSHARCINSVSVVGWGGTLTADGRFAESWQEHVEYNIAALVTDDKLIERGVLTQLSSRRLHEALAEMARREFRFGLCHGDVALWNTLIAGDGTVWLLDWGCAAASVVPHHEINEILRTATPDARQFEAFLAGYGLSSMEYAGMTRELRVLAALREVDTLRWAIEKKPEAIPSLVPRVRLAVANLD